MRNLTTLFLLLSALVALGDEAVRVEYSIRTPIPRRNLKLAPSGNEYYLSVQGDDQNPGTREEPFRNIQTFADIAQPGDICLVREGTYRETVRPKNGGRTGDPIRYAAYPGEKVTISGTEAITGPWSVYQGAIYQTKVDRDVEQLFLDGKMMIEARWPNMRFEDLWERSCWAASGVGSAYETMIDPELAKTDIDWTGAIATLNVAHQFQNAHSLVFNNVTGLIRAEHRKSTPFVHRSNAIHNQLNYAPELRDPEHFDFRPKADSSLIDAGLSMPGLTDSFEGKAPDIGAYEHGGINWRPGYQPRAALFYRNNKAYDKLTD